MSDGQTEEATSSTRVNESASDDSCDIVENNDNEGKEVGHFLCSIKTCSSSPQAKELRDALPLNDISNNGGTEDKDVESTKAIENEQSSKEADDTNEEKPSAKRARQDEGSSTVAMS